MHLQASAVFAPDLKKLETISLSAGVKLTNSHRKPIKLYMIQRGRHFLKISERLTPENYRILTSLLEASRARASQLPDSRKDFQMKEVLSSLSLPESLKTKDLAIFYLKMFPTCWEFRREKHSKKFLKRFQNWGTVWNGLCITAQISECRSQGGESTLQDVLEQTAPEKYYISERAVKKLTGKLSRSSAAVRATEFIKQTV